MKNIRILSLITTLFLRLTLPASAEEIAPSPEWDTFLDGVYAYTWQDQSVIKAKLEQEESRIKQNLKSYISIWDQRFASPIVYTDNSRNSDTCGPLNICASDIIDPVKFIEDLTIKRDPLSVYLFDLLSSKTQKSIVGVSPGNIQENILTPLTEELSRIVSEGSLYDKTRFRAIQLSDVARTLAEDHNDALSRVCINKTLLAEAYPDEIKRNFKCVIYKDEAYRRVVEAKTIHYLRTGENESILEAVALTDKIKGKLSNVDFAFWYYYPRSLADVLKKDSASLISDAYSVLNNVIVAGEAGTDEIAAKEEMKQRNYARSLADVVLSKGIIEGRLPDLEALGSAMWMLGYRNDKILTGTVREKALAQLVDDVKEYLSGPESDNFRLNFAVALREGKRLNALLRDALNKKDNASADKIFAEEREYLQLAHKWAVTGQGKAVAVAYNLELANTALAKMKDILPAENYAALVEKPGAVDGKLAAELIREMGGKEKEGWEQLRFAERKSFIDGAHRLWNAFGQNAILLGDYHLKRMDKDDFYSVMENGAAAEKGLLGYLDLFEQLSLSRLSDILPGDVCAISTDALAYLTYIQYNLKQFKNNAINQYKFNNSNSAAISCLSAFYSDSNKENSNNNSAQIKSGPKNQKVNRIKASNTADFKSGDSFKLQRSTVMANDDVSKGLVYQRFLEHVYDKFKLGINKDVYINKGMQDFNDHNK